MSIDPVVAGANVLVAAHDRVRVFDRDDGSDVFHYRIRRPQRLLAREGSAFVLSTTGAVAFDEDARRPWWDGTRRAWGQLYAWRVAPRPPDQPAMWRLPLDEWSWAALAPWGLAISSGDSVEARAAASGSVLWRREDLEVSVAPIAVAGGLLVVAGDRLCLLASDSGSDLGCLTALGTSIRFVTPVAGVPSSSRTRSWSRWGTDAPRGRLRPGDRGAVRSASDHIHDSAVAIDKT